MTILLQMNLGFAWGSAATTPATADGAGWTMPDRLADHTMKERLADWTMPKRNADS